MQQVNPSLDKPHGYKYALVYIVTVKRIIGYYNSEDKGDHRHYKNSEESYQFKDLRTVVRDFSIKILQNTKRGDYEGKKGYKIGVRNAKDVLDDFVATGEALERGKEVKREKAIYFESIEGFRKALMPKRLELLHTIRKKQPERKHTSACKTIEKGYQSVPTDITILEDLGLIDMKRKKEGRRESKPTVNYNRINLEITVQEKASKQYYYDRLD